MVQCIVAFTDFCYIARRPSHDAFALQEMQAAIDRFHELRTVFEEVGVRPNGFSLPRQHSLHHYLRGIMLFGSPNGLCSSITESRHISAVKRPWRASGRNKFALFTILRTNVRRSKMAAIRAKFALKGMLDGDIIQAAYASVGLAAPIEPIERFVDEDGSAGQDDSSHDDQDDAGASEGERAPRTYVHLGKRPGECTHC